MALPSSLLQAIHRYGPSVQGIAKQYGISGEALLAKLITGESGGRANAVSNMGAQGYAQFMPGTRKIAVDKYGVDPLAGPDQAVHAAALHLRGKLTGATGLEGYNPGGGRGYVDYILGQRVGDVHAGSRSRQGGGDVAGGGGSVVGSVTPGTSTGTGFDPGSGGVSLADLLSQQSQPEPVAAPVLPQAPFGLSKYLHVGQTPQVAPQAPQGSSVDGVLSAINQAGQELPDVSTTAAQTNVTGSASSGPTAHASSSAMSAHGGLDYPLGARGKIIGTPYKGTHTDFGNWESDNAVDIGVRKGTPVVATADGVIGSQIGPLDSSNPQLAGQRLHLVGKGNEWYYAHLSRITVKPGQRVRKGQIIGYSGAANGVEHLHIASKRGNPLNEFGR